MRLVVTTQLLMRANLHIDINLISHVPIAMMDGFMQFEASNQAVLTASLLEQVQTSLVCMGMAQLPRHVMTILGGRVQGGEVFGGHPDDHTTVLHGPWAVLFSMLGMIQ